jgi:excisionase family DNA binding protein
MDPEPLLADGPPRGASAAEAATIDRALQLAYSQLHRFATRLAPGSLAPSSLAHLRAGPLGRDLWRLAALARGEDAAPQDQVVAAVEAVVQLLFWPAAGATFQVPRAFWASDLGLLLARAKFRAFAPAELVGISAAAARLGVARPTVYRWVDDGVLGSVRDEVSGRTFVLGCDLAAAQAKSPA